MSFQTTNKITALLQRNRLNEAPPFYICGLAFAGTTYVKKFNKIQMFYIVLFICEGTRVLHLELVTDMKTDYFLLTF